MIRFCVTYEHATKEQIGKWMIRPLYTLTIRKRSIITPIYIIRNTTDTAWEGIRNFADEVLESQSPNSAPLQPLQPIQPIKKPKKPLTRTMSARFSFTRSVSREIFERQNSRGGLTDGCTPIIVLDTDEILNGLQRATRKNTEAHHGRRTE